MSRWRYIEQTWCNWPSRPIGLIEFIGGSYLSASPHISYKYLLEDLARKGLAIHAWAYLPSFDHQSQANTAWKDFRACRKILESRVGIKLNPLRLGHSLGSKLHLISPDRGRNSEALISISFNNFNVNRSIPIIGKLSSKLNFETGFSPSPKETLDLIYKNYLQSKNLIISFSNDQLDQSSILFNCLQKRLEDATIQIQLEGDHLTPVSSGLRQNLFGNWATDSSKLKTLQILVERIIIFSKKQSTP
tara:strand:- start:89 stop:829 length:741 start_codon:yes stop_codon:yes gene_type:complete